MKRRYHLQFPFWVYCGLTLLVAAAAMNSGYNLLYWVFGIMAAALLVSGIVSGMMMMGLRVRRTTPGFGIVGHALTIRYSVTNRNRFFPVFNVCFEERPVADGAGWQRLLRAAPAWVMHIGPREAVHGEAVLWPRQRGVARFVNLRMWTTFPFGIIRKSVTVAQEQHLPIYPRLYALRRRVLETIVPAAALGTRVSPHAGAGDDIYGLREFRHGDSMRHIAWKRTANRDELVCIERTRPSPPKLRIVLNLTAPTGRLAATERLPIARELEERAISLVASIAHAADAAGYEIGLTILGVDDAPLPVRRGRWHRHRIMTALAEIDLDAPRRPGRAAVRADVASAGVVVVHPDWADLSVVTGEAWHFTARQIDHLVEPASDVASSVDDRTAPHQDHDGKGDTASEAAA